MKATMAYATKRALFDLLAAQTGAGGPLADVQVGYRYPTGITRVAVYGGGVRFTQDDAAAENSQERLVVDERISVAVIVKVVKPGEDVRDSDALAEQTLDTICAILDSGPILLPAVTWAGLAGGQGDYEPAVDASSTIAVEAVFLATLT